MENDNEYFDLIEEIKKKRYKDPLVEAINEYLKTRNSFLSSHVYIVDDIKK